MNKGTPDATVRDHLANERTFLAYIRTALAFIGFGFVIARFAVFTREFALMERHSQSGQGISTTFGVLMVVMGIAIGAFGAFRYIRQLRALSVGRAEELSVKSAVIIASVIGVFGAAMAFVLFRI
ncbi:MAG: DUF202 domain-containing protein [Candidatus Eremiobacteraeota bacterium]|nr:DUF202 domain-containing protein [Candidatus Eremiobacteraeota bacterium]